MKKVYLFLALAIPMMASAQLLEVASTERVAANADAKVAAFSPNGDYLLLTNTSNQGLQRMDLATQKVTKITSADGAGYNVKIAQDGNQIVYREVTFDATKSRVSNIIRHDLAANKAQVVAKQQSHLAAMVADVVSHFLTVRRKRCPVVAILLTIRRENNSLAVLGHHQLTVLN